MARGCVLIILVICFTLVGCATVYNPATGQNELIYVTTPVEVSLGKMVAAKVAQQFSISNDPEKNARLTKIGRGISNVSDRKDLVYHFYVIEDKSLNAFTTPGGYVYVNSGLMEETADDELACVVGHEVGHVAARHAAKKLQAQIGYDILMSIAMRSQNIRTLQRAASISFDLIMLGYSREDETLADKLGVKYAYKAGYDPKAMITFLEKLKEKDGTEVGVVFLRSHPYTSQRIKTLESYIPSMANEPEKKVQKQERLLNTAVVAVEEEKPLKVMCPKCKKVFPGKMNYCPYDGEKLQ